MMRSFTALLVFVGSTLADFDAAGGLHHLLNPRKGTLHHPEPELDEEHMHGDWNRDVIARSPHYTKKVVDSTGLEYDLTYYDTGDANITHGDIALPRDFTEHLHAHADHETAKIHMLGVVATSTRSIWPCPIPYVNNLRNDAGRVNDAIAHLEQYTRWRFVQRTNEANYIDFVDSSGCSSFIGMIGGRQAINLATGCNYAATVHEIMHAMGIYHEQSRPDRDQYVRINTQNIQAGTENNFDICRNCEQVQEYDYMSVMHYGSTAFSVNRQPTIEPIGGSLPQGVCSMGQRRGLSYGDTFACMARFDTSSGCGANANPPAYDFDVCQGTGIQSSAPNGGSQTTATTTQATTTQTQATTRTNPPATNTDSPVSTDSPDPAGTCNIYSHTAHQGFPYTGAIAQILFLQNEEACCDQCTAEGLCASWTFLNNRGTTYCLLYSTQLDNPYTGVVGYTSGDSGVLAVPQASEDEDVDLNNDTPYIVGGVVGASAIAVGGAAAYRRSKKKVGKKSTARSGYSSSKNVVEKEVALAMRAHDKARAGGEQNPAFV